MMCAQLPFKYDTILNNSISNNEILEQQKKAGLSKKGMKTWNKGIKTGPNIEHSKRMKGKIPSNKGRRMTEKQKLKISNSCKGKKWYHNPITGKTGTFYLDAQPPGFILGRI